MKIPDLKNRNTWAIISIVTFFTIFALWLRLLPLLTLGNADNMNIVGSDDPLYNLRLVEHMLANNMNYPWFDAMTQYPIGTPVYWGPLFTTVIAIACLLVGATTRPEILNVLLIVPPLMGVALVPVMYYAGKVCGDWKTGLITSGFTAVIAGTFFYRSIYGYADHHIAEVLFSAIFCLLYMYTLLSEKDKKIDLKDIGTYKSALLLAFITGIAYFLGLMVMPTMILFAMIAGIYTILQFIIDRFRGKSSEYLLIINAVVFTVVTVSLLVFGLKNTTGLDLTTYSIGHIYAYIGLIAGSVILYALQQYLTSKDKLYYPGVIAGIGIVTAVILSIVNPQLYSLFISNFFSFFGQVSITNTVQEARGWTMELAWSTFNYSIILMIGGFLVMLYNNIKDDRPEQVFAMVWSVIIFASTWQHVRYEYYMALNAALLAAVCISFTLSGALPNIKKIISGRPEPIPEEEIPKRKGKKQRKGGSSATAPDMNPSLYIPVIILIAVAGLGLIFAYNSVTIDYLGGVNKPIQMNPDWKESALWMKNNTPETGVDYYKDYDKSTFIYPNQSYGVMSWWDYGHIITTIGNRIPTANPFQQGVAGNNGSAAYFMSVSEDEANRILDDRGTRYIITDVEMAQGKLWAMATWYNETLAASPYYDTLYYPNQEGGVNVGTFNKQNYYETMVIRLHNLDGSMTKAGDVIYIEYTDPFITKMALPVITNGGLMNHTEAITKAEAYKQSAPAIGYHAAVYNTNVLSPIEDVSALQHYRLVHESPTNVFASGPYDLKYVKVFEYVKGAHIKGEGIIEVPIVTNTGRAFTYRQESVNGEFIVPYSTGGSSYDVKTTGGYKIAGSGTEYEVSELAVMQGQTIN
jgi:dolichyl-diphosphooligosaccharide--protein glycosyltransferase